MTTLQFLQEALCGRYLKKKMPENPRETWREPQRQTQTQEREKERQRERQGEREEYSERDKETVYVRDDAVDISPSFTR